MESRVFHRKHAIYWRLGHGPTTLTPPDICLALEIANKRTVSTYYQYVHHAGPTLQVHERGKRAGPRSIWLRPQVHPRMGLPRRREPTGKSPFFPPTLISSVSYATDTTPVDPRTEGRRPMDSSIGQTSQVPRNREYSEKWNASIRPRRASALGHRDPTGK